MYLKTLLNHVEYEWLKGHDVDITGISIDTRTLNPGDLFFCIVGETTYDSHLFIDEAAAKGASAVVLERPCEVNHDIPVISVKSSRIALSTIAVNFYGDPSAHMNLIGVTGTNGKTSVTYYLESILQSAGRSPGVIGSSNARINGVAADIAYKTPTTPDTPELLRILDRMHGSGVSDVCMEVTSHALALHKVDGLKFKAGIFTNLTQDHLDFHKTMDRYLCAKKRLFEFCKTGIINADDMAAAEIIGSAPCGVITYGINSRSDIQAYDILYGNGGVSFSVDLNGSSQRFNINVPGKFSVYNALAAISAAAALSVPAEYIIEGLGAMTGVPGRFQSLPNTAGISVIIDYAHTPDALANIIRSAREFTAGRIITVFGCGGDRDKTKRALMGRIAGSLSDLCYVTTDNPRSEDPDDIIAEIERGITETDCVYRSIADRNTAINASVADAIPNDTVIIAGKGSEEYQEFNGRTIRFSDAQTAADALHRREG